MFVFVKGIVAAKFPRVKGNVSLAQKKSCHYVASMDSDPVELLRAAIDAKADGNVANFASAVVYPQRYSPRSVRLWLSGKQGVPPHILPVLRRLAARGAG